MDLFAIAASGMAAATSRLNVAASNIVHDSVDSGQAQGGPPAPPAPYQPLQLVQFSLPGGGVGAEVVAGAPLMDLGTELVDLSLAADQFKASVAIFEAGDQVMKSVLGLKA